jgi:hypothetical protein
MQSDLSAAQDSSLPNMIDGPAYSPETEALLEPIHDSYYAAQNESVYEFVQRDKVIGFLDQWVEHETDIENPQWNFDSFTQYRVLDHDWKHVSSADEKLYYCTFSDGAEQFGFAVIKYDATGPSVQNYSITETPNSFYDLDAVLNNLAEKLVESDLDLATTKAERVSWLDRENNRSDETILFTDAVGVRYYYYLGDFEFALHKAET